MDLQSATANNFIEGCKICSNLETLVTEHTQKHSSSPNNHLPFCVTCLNSEKDVAAHTRKHASNSDKTRTPRKKSCSCRRKGSLKWHRQCDILENERQLMREMKANQDSNQLNVDPRRRPPNNPELVQPPGRCCQKQVAAKPMTPPEPWSIPFRTFS